MEELSKAINIICGVLEISEGLNLVGKKIDVNKYSTLRDTIPDRFVQIDEVFPQSELPQIWEGYKDYLIEDEVFPFAGTLGDAVICIGYGIGNKMAIYYFDFDFGLVQMNSDDLYDFLEGLV